MKILLFLAIFLPFNALYQAADLKISLYYETLCPYSKSFVVDQLYPTYKLLGDVLEVELVPFGKATAEKQDNGSWTFTCQHGPDECYGNKYHSCAIALNPIEISEEFVYCSMNSDDGTSDEVMDQCSKQAGTTWGSLRSCYESGQADELLVKNGERTAAVTPKITGIPTIIFNDQFNSTLEDEAVENLLGVVCDLLQTKPDACSTF